jgi:2-polyprenyl-6-methoxyphenol hydroxylase-like FAD-dependent oxidoreductase
VIHLDIHDLDPLPSYVNGRVALLGDAAHAMSPDRGQGAGQSIEDAVVLAAALADQPAIETALRRYDAERRPRTQATVRGARTDGRRGGGAADAGRAVAQGPGTRRQRHLALATTTHMRAPYAYRNTGSAMDEP